ncbi:hypothetical protein [Pseudoxanthomonas dokdonensis]|uniref:hypothetical protein n=1 Tax=Pseudoxanthomonas dokdonensis TaxID=344882 RepID=UPI000AF7B0FE|nr:hypothetical protein [Pseudoxanthomonas dokdonensis]
MSLNSQTYANLADDCYDATRKSSIRKPEEQDYIWPEGVQFKVLELYDVPKISYQGTIYQRVDTGEIIVAHRGTELDREKIIDALYPDGGTTWKRGSQQLPQAIALMESGWHHRRISDLIAYCSARPAALDCP